MNARLGPLGAPLAIVLAWVTVRAAVLIPWAEDVEVRDRSAPRSAIAVSPVERPRTFQPVAAPGAGDPAQAYVRLKVFARQPAQLPSLASRPTTPLVQPATPEAFVAAPPFKGENGIVAGYVPPARAPRRPFTGSGWMLINGTGGAVGVPSLGGSQAGLRVYMQGPEAPLALTARISRALGGAHDTEVSAGYALRARTLGLLVERRERLDVKSGAFVATAYGGLFDVSLPLGLRLDGFAQGGVAGLRQRRWFADGQARMTRRAAVSSDLSIGIGGGAWASAQQGARRVEAGPLVEARVRTGSAGLRIAGEYRFRVTGDANPRSGPALTVGVDF